MVMSAPDADPHARRHDDGPMVVMVLVPPIAMMMMVMMLRDLHLTASGHDVLLARGPRRRVGRPQRRHGVRDRIEQLGI